MAPRRDRPQLFVPSSDVGIVLPHAAACLLYVLEGFLALDLGLAGLHRQPLQLVERLAQLGVPGEGILGGPQAQPTRQAATGQLESHGKLRAGRKEIARIYTIMRERELGITTGGAA